MGQTEKTALACLSLDEITFQRGEVIKVAFHPLMLLFYAGFVSFLVVLDANGTRYRMTGPSHSLAYLTGAAAAIAFIVAGLKLAEARARASGKDVLVNGSLTCFGSALIAMLVGETVTAALVGRPTLSFIEGIVLAVFYYGLIELVMVFLTAYILPRVQARVRGTLRERPDTTVAAAPDAAAPMPANLAAVPDRTVVTSLPKRPAGIVRVGTARFAPCDIRRVEAEGNYVRIVTPTGRLLLPGPFSQVVGQLPESAGQIVSRSCWIAASAIVAHRRQGRDLYVMMDDGTEAKVAAGRRDAVKVWLQSIGQARPLQAG